jgi:hypothetical protein
MTLYRVGHDLTACVEKEQKRAELLCLLFKIKNWVLFHILRVRIR